MEIQLIEEKDLKSLTAVRSGELKIGETLIPGSRVDWDQIEHESFKYVILGLCEDIGPRANHGRGGADSSWEALIPQFVNLQANRFLSGSQCCLFGCLRFEESQNDIQSLREKVKSIDHRVAGLIKKIVEAGKTPIVIGGGHNNAYGLLKGCSQAIDQPLNCINLDPHADFRALEGRHSGNGFSYAKAEGFLGNYGIVGLHESYNSQSIYERMDSEGVRYDFFEDIFVRAKKSFAACIREQLKWLGNSAYGIELDMDSIENFPASAQTPSGISPNLARQYLHLAASNKNAIYLHLAEAAPILVKNSAKQVGKMLGYLISDFIKAREEKA